MSMTKDEAMNILTQFHGDPETWSDFVKKQWNEGGKELFRDALMALGMLEQPATPPTQEPPPEVTPAPQRSDDLEEFFGEPRSVPPAVEDEDDDTPTSPDELRVGETITLAGEQYVMGADGELYPGDEPPTLTEEMHRQQSITPVREDIETPEQIIENLRKEKMGGSIDDLDAAYEWARAKLDQSGKASG